MKIKYSKKFLKELADLPTDYRTVVEHFVFDILPELNNIFEINKIESLKGYKKFYKIRFGNYRVGLKLEGDYLIIERVLHRKEIYKYFP